MKFINNKHGQGIVEFAFVVPLLVFLLVGFMHMALVLHDYLAVSEATREIARYAAVGKSREDILERVKIGTTGFYRIVDPKTDIEVPKPNESKKDEKLGEYIEVSVTVHFDSSQGVLLTEPFMPKKLSTKLTMRKE